jgi:hypothetical protein
VGPGNSRLKSRALVPCTVRAGDAQPAKAAEAEHVTTMWLASRRCEPREEPCECRVEALLRRSSAGVHCDAAAGVCGWLSVSRSAERFRAPGTDTRKISSYCAQARLGLTCHIAFDCPLCIQLHCYTRATTVIRLEIGPLQIITLDRIGPTERPPLGRKRLGDSTCYGIRGVPAHCAGAPWAEQE